VYVSNNPLNRVDPDGTAAETPWDALNVATGAASLVSNLLSGNVGGAALDAAGLVYDSVATGVPGLPGGAATLIRAARSADKVADVVKGADRVADAAKAGDKVADAARAEQLATNKQVGAAFEEAVLVQKQTEQTGVVTQLTVKTDTGVKTRIDVAGRDASGNVRLTEAKASQTAPLTPNQKKAHPEIEKSGATVAGKGKPGFPGGSRIRPTRVELCRACGEVKNQ
jgi:hypothetical protein